ncbi:hypothetical protein [Streptomyces chilikensis]|uniref:hypothetical protein n=1 Tax=Streptomyces chilikensis TaxID=1194079 RepID=UPI000A82D90A|nr:hypothetical protein [Streptomyces chilikensis]
MDTRHIFGYVGTGVASLALGIAIGVASVDGDAAPQTSPQAAATVAPPTREATVKAERVESEPKGDWTAQEWAREFKAYTKKHGTEHQKAAVAHVVKIKNIDGNDDNWWAEDVKIFTDFGGSDYDYESEAELILDALTDWQESVDGDVSVEVYNAAGDGQGYGNF